MRSILAVVVQPDTGDPVTTVEVDSRSLLEFLRILRCETLGQLVVPAMGMAVLVDKDGHMRRLPVNVRATAFVKNKAGIDRDPLVPLRGTVVFVGSGDTEWGTCPMTVINSLVDFTKL